MTRTRTRTGIGMDRVKSLRQILSASPKKMKGNGTLVNPLRPQQPSPVALKTSARAPIPSKPAKYAPGQIVVTRSGKRYIVDQNMKYVPLTSKLNARRSELEGSQQRNSKSKKSKKSNSKSKSVSAPRAGSLQLVNGQTYVVGEDRKTYIPITQSAAAGTGVLTTLLGIVAVVLVTDLVVDLIIDDLQLPDMEVSGWNAGNVGNLGDFGDVGGYFDF